MPQKLDFPIPFDGPSVPWFVDPRHRRIHRGVDYNARCIAVVGPHDFARALFHVTANPRQLQWSMNRASDAPLIVHEAWWSIAQGTARVHAEVVRLLDKAKVPQVEGWVTIPKGHLLPLLQVASDKAGIPSRRHQDFESFALGIETEKLRARLTAADVDPDVVAAHRYL